MKLRSALLCALSLGFASAGEFGLTHVRTVYLLPMGAGMDQFVANRLAAGGTYQVVTDPALADAVITDRIGSEFEERLRELYPPPPPAEVDKKADQDKPGKQAEEPSVAALMGEASTGRRTSTFSRSKGNLFLVDRKTNRVLWSTYLRPKSTRPDDLNRAADEIVDRLRDAVGKQAKQSAKEQAASTPAK